MQKRAEKGKGGLNMKLQLSDVGRWTTGPCPWRTTPKSKGKRASQREQADMSLR